MTLASEVAEAAGYVFAKQPHRPTVGLILGSGLGALADAVERPAVVEFGSIPGMAPSTVEGHRGRLVVGSLEGRTVAVMQGRLHAYEGYTPQQTTFPVRLLRGLGCGVLVVTNAAGGLNPAFRVGDLMLISDHISLPGMVGHNPLYGPNDPAMGPRFPDMSAAYDPDLRRLAHRQAARLGFGLQEGVYAMLGGPSYETPAEVRFLRIIGADAVGMSTASEVVVARHGGMRVLGVSMISNAIPVAGAPAAEAVHTAAPAGLLGHEEVLAAGAAAAPRLLALIRAVLGEL
jgi:purine-nucleoside phosphorylase